VTRAELRERLRAEVSRWEQKSFLELAALTYPVTYDTGVPKDPSFYQTEVTLLEKTPDFIHLAVAVSDGGVSALVPVTGDVIVGPSGPK
jgi:hypothetical protein